MALKLYNTLSRKKEFFKPLKDKKVNLFVCGPTTYDFSHLGHARTYVVFDMIAKYLKEKGYKVFYVQNITDIDDKIITRAIKKKVFWKDLSRKFEKEYLKDMKALNINSVTKYARATAHIKEIISQVNRLLKKGFAYQIKDGIYFDISKFKDYGKLSRRTVWQAEDAVSRIDTAEEKRNKGDFCLWKFSKTEEPSWPFDSLRSLKVKAGRPGWHIEDTAITEKYFGSQYDIHGGARDLIFPHHEAEIAQMEAISGKKPLVKYWLHSGFLTVKGKKMAKSLGNFITIRDFLNRYSARILRLFVIKTHYRSPIDYDEKAILQTKRELKRIDEFINKLKNRASIYGSESKNIRSSLPFAVTRVGEEEDEVLFDYQSAKRKTTTKNLKLIKSFILKTQRDFERAMADDFNTSKAVASIFNLVNKGNSLIAQNELTQAEARNILDFLKKTDKIFNFIFWEKIKTGRPAGRGKIKLLNLVKQRERYRKEGNWQKADEIRRKIKDLGYQIEDTKEGPKIKKLS